MGEVKAHVRAKSSVEIDVLNNRLFGTVSDQLNIYAAYPKPHSEYFFNTFCRYLVWLINLSD